MPKVTVLTATYNRAEKLRVLYRSLREQTNKDFIWMIIDDGSTDNTSSEVSEWISEADFEIIYKRKENGGKHRALNLAEKYIDTELTFIVDSDDHLTSDAVEIIEAKYSEYKNEDDLCGFSFLRGKPDGGYLSSSGVPYDGIKESFCECRLNRSIAGDMAEVWYTKALKEYPFPEFENERFIGEDVVWVRMSEKYKMRFFNNVIYISDYLDDGLTNNRRKHNIRSPKGCVKRAEAFLEADIKIKYKIKAMLQYIIYGKFAGISKGQFKKSQYKWLYLLMYIPACVMYKDWKRKYM